MSPLCSYTKIRLLPDGEHFRLDGDLPAVVIPARNRHGVVCDLVAYAVNNPDQWFLREGDETLLLGARELTGAALMGGTIPLYPRPVDWLEAGGRGICVLRWDVPLLDPLRDVQIDLNHLEAELAEQLDKALRKNFASSLPRIRSPRRRRHAA